MAKELDTRDHELGSKADLIITAEEMEFLKEHRAKKESLKPMNKAYLDELAFMEEEIVVMVHGSHDRYAEPIVEVGVNGQRFMFQRDRQVRAKRKFVNALIVMQENISTPRSQNMVEMSFDLTKTFGHKYPFSVVEDKNKKGAEWLRQRMAEVN